MTERTAALPGAGNEAKIREQLDRILHSKVFLPVDRLRRFLSFIVAENLSGRGENLKEFLVGVEVFGKEASFDPRMDPIVRVQARRLRARLSRYYREEGGGDAVVIELPKGGYSPLFHYPEPASEPKPPVLSALAARNTVEVAPFTDDTQEQDLQYLCRGLTEEVIHRLANTRKLRVMVARSPDERVEAAMRISGSVRRSADTLRVATRLMDAASGTCIWSFAIDRDAANPFALQEEVAAGVLERLQTELSGHGSRKAWRPTENVAAYNLYLQGTHQLAQRTEEGLRRAAQFFEKATAEDPQYGQAFAGLSDAYALLGHYGALSPADVWTKVASNAAWAVLLDDDSAEAHASLAHAKSTQDWDFLSAEREFQRAIALDPRYATAHHWYAVSCLAPLGRLDEALREILLAATVDPVSSIVSRDVAMTYYYRREFETALDRCDHTIEQNPHFVAAYWALGLIQEQRGDLEEAIAAFRRAVQLAPQNPRMRGGLARVLAVSKRRDEAERILAELHELAGKRYVSPFELATIHFAFGEIDEGYRWLTKAFEDRCFELIVAKVDPRFDPLRNHSRFKELSAQLGVA